MRLNQALDFGGRRDKRLEAGAARTRKTGAEG